MYNPRLSFKENEKLDSSAQKKQVVIDESTRKLIASDKQLAERGIQVLEKQTETLKELGERQIEACKSVGNTLDQVSNKVNMANSILVWGLSSISNSLLAMESTLQNICAAVENTERAWSYSRYKECLEDYRKGLHSEALSDIMRAIEGSGQYHIGQRDPHFYVLLGSLRLGRIRNTEQNLIDYGKAEDAFLLAVRYAENDYPKEAAEACLNASISAYLNENVERALDHVNKAIILDGTLMEAKFQKAKILCQTGAVNGIFTELLLPTLEYDPTYAVKSATDDDIKKHDRDLNNTIIIARDALRKKALHAKDEVELTMEKSQSAITSLKMIKIGDKILQDKEMQKIKAALKKSGDDFSSETLEGYWRAYHRYVNTVNMYKELVLRHVGSGIGNEHKARAPLDYQISEEERDRINFIEKLPYIFAIIGALLFNCFILFLAFTSNDPDFALSRPFKDHVISNLFVIALDIVVTGISGYIFGGVLGTILAIFYPGKERHFETRKQEVSRTIQEDITKLSMLKKLLT